MTGNDPYKPHKRRKKTDPALILFFVVLMIIGELLFAGVSPEPYQDPTTVPAIRPTLNSTTQPTIQPEKIPDFCGDPFVVLNDGEPFFTDADLVTKSYEYYAPLDSLERCGVTMACVGRDIMPTDERGSISSVKPTGWVQAYYDFVDGNALYNRCHLLGFQLTGENANKLNLITGTRYMNVDGMLPFENMIADFVKETGYHVIYRVTPIFEGDDLVARGVRMEAKSVEDNGEGICFHVFCYNVQPGVTIDYATGESRLSRN